jgi:hypothetical protein
VSLRREQITRLKREPSRSRFHVALTLAGVLLLAGCSNHYGFGITELPAERGWQPLPIESWVLNDGLSAKAMSFCPRATCTEQGFAALITLEGREADAMEKTLATDPARLARDFAKPASKDASKTAKTAKPTAPKSTTTVSRFSEDGAQGLLVEIRARDASGKRAVTAILSGRDGSRLKLALGVSPDPDAARNQARAAWRDR